MYSDKISLYTIAKCNLKDRENSSYWIPNIQRGIVWKAIQMELLWDSILRGFPIGSMLVLDHGQQRGEILDGQQRANSIICGFNIDNLLEETQKIKTIIWLDIAYEPTESDNERRAFGIRVTNSSHPWGFDDTGGRLSAQDRRESIELAYGDNYPRDKSQWDIRNFIPYYFYKRDSTGFMPVPLAIFVSAAEGLAEEDYEIFWSRVKKSLYDFSEYAPYWKEKLLNPIINLIDQFAQTNDRRLFNTFIGLNTYEVVFNFVNSDDDIELLFNRVNRRGTPITSLELTYAAIKHYGELICNLPEIGQLIKDYSNGLMMEHLFAQIAFRYCFSDEKIHGDVSAEQIRALAFTGNNEKNETIKSKIKSFFYEEKLNITVTRINEILLSPSDGPCQLPNYLIAEIATKSPELIILLLCIIDNYDEIFEEKDDQFVKALIFYLYCFSSSKEPIRKIYEEICTQYCTKESIRNILRDSISRGWCIPLLSSFKDFPAIDENINSFNNTWNLEKFSNTRGYLVFERLFKYGTPQGMFMLKFALNTFYKTAYADYNPSLREYWEDINCPWDHDHIIPRNWIQENDWAEVINTWINSTGNIADIPFEENRSKSDKPDFHYYFEHSKELLFEDGFAKLNPQMFGQGVGADLFMKLIKNRFLSMSTVFLNLFKRLKIENSLSPLQQKRKEFCEYLHYKYENGRFRNYQLYYKGEGDKVVPCEFDSCNYFIQRPSLFLISKEDSSESHALSISFNDYDTSYFKLECGKYSVNESKWIDGSMLARDSVLFANEGEIDPLAKILINGAEIMTTRFGLHGFETNSLSILSFKTTIKEIKIVAYIYTYYKRCYCTIRTEDSTKLPQSILDKFTDDMGFKWRTETSIDCCLSGTKYNIEDVCAEFAKMMRILQSLA